MIIVPHGLQSSRARPGKQGRAHASHDGAALESGPAGELIVEAVNARMQSCARRPSALGRLGSRPAVVLGGIAPGRPWAS